MRAIRALVLAALAVELAAGGSVRALLIDGPEWQPQTAALKSILEASDVLHVDVLSAPPKGNPFEPAFDRYKVVVLNYGGDGVNLGGRASLARAYRVPVNPAVPRFYSTRCPVRPG